MSHHAAGPSGSRIDGPGMDDAGIGGRGIDGRGIGDRGIDGPGVDTGIRGDRPEIPRPHLAVALAGALRTTARTHRAAAAAAATVCGDVVLCDQLCLLSPAWRVALRRAESEAMDKLGVGIGLGGAHRIDAETAEAPETAETADAPETVEAADATGTTGTCSVIVVHGDGWSLVGRTPAVLVFLLDAAPGVVIDRSAAEGAGGLVRGLAAQFT